MQTLPVALKHEKQPGLGGGGVMVTTAPDKTQRAAQLCLVAGHGHDLWAG